MNAPRGISVGLVALLLACAALGAFGLRSIALESQRARTKHLTDALEAVSIAAWAFEARLDELERGELDGVVALELDDDGSLRPLLGPRPAGELRSAADPSLQAFLAAEVDRLEREGELDAARERLRSAAAREEDPWLVAWAKTALAALARRAGEEEAERAALEDLAALPVEVRDQRGLSRALAARHALQEMDGAPFDERLALFSALVDDHRSQGEGATAELTARVRAALAPPDDAAVAALEEVQARDALRARLRALEASAAAAFLFAAVAGERRALQAPADPLRAGEGPVPWVVARSADGALRGYALELEALGAAALDQPEVLVFARAGLALELAPRGQGPAALATRDLPLAGAEELELRAAARDLEALVAAQRRRFAVTAGLTGVALLVALLAAVATARAVAREARAAREREAFVAAVSHELRTPLAATRLLAELMAQGGVEEEKVVEFARRIGVESERLSRLVSSILDLARLEGGGEADAPRETVDLRELAAEAGERFRPLAREAGFAVELRAGDAPLMVTVEREALTGALLNLLDNARKYSDEPHAIELALERAGGMARARVLDRGRGVPGSERERVFEAFARVGDEDTRDRPGAGLGLALVKRVVVAHGGGITCRPREGGGSEFVIELPLCGAALAEGGA